MMKKKLLGFSLIAMLAMTGCDNSNGSAYNLDLPKGGEVVDLKVEANRKALMQDVTSGLSGMLAAAISKGISFKTEANMDAQYDVYVENEVRTSMKMTGLKETATLDVKANIGKLTSAEGVEALKGVEAVANYKFSGDVNITEKGYTNSEGKPEVINTDLKFDKVGAKVELTEGVIYADLSDRSLLKNGLANYDEVAELINAVGTVRMPTKAELALLLPLDKGQTVDSYLTAEWKKSGLDKIYISVDEINQIAEMFDEEEIMSGPVQYNRASPSSAIGLVDLSGLEETIGVLANIEGALEYKVYKNETAGLKISLDTRKIAECSMLAEYIDNFGTMEGFEMTAQDYAAYNETFGKFDLEAVVLFDDVSRITSLTMSIDANVTSYDSYYDSVNNTEIKEKDNTTIIKGKSKITANYDGMKKTPAKEHKDYVSVMSFVEEYEDLLEPAK